MNLCFSHPHGGGVEGEDPWSARPPKCPRLWERSHCECQNGVRVGPGVALWG